MYIREISYAVLCSRVIYPIENPPYKIEVKNLLILIFQLKVKLVIALKKQLKLNRIESDQFLLKRKIFRQ